MVPISDGRKVFQVVTNLENAYKSDAVELKHIIEYIYDSWKQNKIKFKNPNKNSKRIPFTYHDPCRLSRFLPKDNNITEKTREIFKEFKQLGYEFNEMEHNKKNSLCCGVSCWMNCNEKSKALQLDNSFLYISN